MDEEIYVEAFGFRFEVIHKGFDDNLGDMAAGVEAVSQHLDRLGHATVRGVWEEALQAHDDVDGIGTTPRLGALESLAYRTATQHWDTKPTDAYIWLTPVRQ